MELEPTHESDSAFDLASVDVRAACLEDQPAIRALFLESLLDGQIRDNDTGADIENLAEGYFADDGASGFWVACHDGRVVGMVGVQRTAENAAEIRRLRVTEHFRRKGIGSRLMQQAINFCRDQEYLRVVLDVRVERAPAIQLFERFGFVYSRSRAIDRHRTLDFYLDLYSDKKGS